MKYPTIIFRTHFTLITFHVLTFLIYFTNFGFAQGDLFPAFPSDLTYKTNYYGDTLAYMDGQVFTGLLVDPTSKAQIGQFNNGYRNGKFVTFHANDRKKTEANYSAGKLNGIFIEWYANGKIKNEFSYKSGKYAGNQRMWYENGKRKYTGDFLNGNKEGLQIEYYENDSIHFRSYYSNGKLNGDVMAYFSNGQLQYAYKYSNGIIKSDIPFILYLENGQKDRIQIFRDGKLAEEKMYKDGQLYEPTVEYFPGNKVKKAEGTLKNSKRDGKWTEWWENGNIKAEYNYVDNELEGTVIEYYSNGEINKESIYNRGTLQQVIFENKVDPSTTIQSKMKPGCYLLLALSGVNRDTSTIMLYFTSKNGNLNSGFKNNILKALDLRFDFVRKDDFIYYHKKQLQYSITISEPAFSTFYDDGVSSTTFAMTLLDVKVSPGYRGVSEFNYVVKDEISGNILLNIINGPMTSVIYPSQSEALQHATEFYSKGIEENFNKLFLVKADIMKAVVRNNKGLVKTLLINKGSLVGLHDKYVFQVFSEDNLSRPVGIVEISDLQANTSTCKVLEGEETIGMLLDKSTKLYAIQIKNLIIKK